MRLSAAGLAGSAAHPVFSGSATTTPAQSPVHQQYSSFCWNIRDQGMTAKAKDSHPENGESKSACVGLARAGLVVRSIPRWCLPSRFRVRAGPRSCHRTLSDFRSAECVKSPAHLKGSCGVSPPRWVWRRQRAGFDQRGNFLPKGTLDLLAPWRAWIIGEGTASCSHLLVNPVIRSAKDEEYQVGYCCLAARETIANIGG